MPINKNHEFEELNGEKCGVVEKNVSPERAEFLRNLLEFNRYTVVVVLTPAPKAPPIPPKPATAAAEGPILPPQPDAVPAPPAPSVADPEASGLPKAMPETFTVGVTDITFNPINAIFGRLLRTPDNHIVTLAYWQQKEDVPNDEVPYFQNRI